MDEPPAAPPLQPQQQPEDDAMCRYCFEGMDAGPLISPCRSTPILQRVFSNTAETAAQLHWRPEVGASLVPAPLAEDGGPKTRPQPLHLQLRNFTLNPRIFIHKTKHRDDPAHAPTACHSACRCWSASRRTPPSTATTSATRAATCALRRACSYARSYNRILVCNEFVFVGTRVSRPPGMS
jgi:hypothetical protein